MSNIWKRDWKKGDPNHPDVHNLIGERFYERFDVRDFGASFAANDNSVAIQAAIDAAGNGFAYLPPGGEFKTTQPIYLTRWNSGLIGQGVIRYSGSGYAVVIGNSSYPSSGLYFTGITLQGISIFGTSSGLAGIRHHAASYCTVRDVKIGAFSAGAGILYENYGNINEALHVNISSCDVGIRIATNGATGAYPANATAITGGHIGGNRIGILIGDESATESSVPLAAQGLTIDKVTFQSNSQCAVKAVDGRQIRIANNYFEDNGGLGNGHIELGHSNAKPTQVLIHDNEIVSSSSAGQYGVLMNNADLSSVYDNTFWINRASASAVKQVAGHGNEVRHNFNHVLLGTDYDGIQEGAVVASANGTSYRIIVGNDGALSAVLA